MNELREWLARVIARKINGGNPGNAEVYAEHLLTALGAAPESVKEQMRKVLETKP